MFSINQSIGRGCNFLEQRNVFFAAGSPSIAPTFENHQEGDDKTSALITKKIEQAKNIIQQAGQS